MSFVAAKRGRPRGLQLNTPAIEHQLVTIGMTKLALASSADMTSGHLADCLHSRKGVSITTAHKLAAALRCPVGMICPEVTGYFTARREGEAVVAA